MPLGSTRLRPRLLNNTSDNKVVRPKQHAGELRRLAAEVISLSGVARSGRRHQLELTERLAADDPALLLGPLAATRPHLTSSHPATADHLGDVVERIDRVERASRRP